MTDDINKQLNDLEKAVDKAAKIKNAATDSGFDWSLLKKPPPRLSAKWVAIAVGAYVLVIVTFLLLQPKDGLLFNLLFVAGLACCGWAAFSAHCRFEQTTATTVGSLFGITILLVSSGLIPPEAVAKTFKEWLEKK